MAKTLYLIHDFDEIYLQSLQTTLGGEWDLQERTPEEILNELSSSENPDLFPVIVLDSSIRPEYIPAGVPNGQANHNGVGVLLWLRAFCGVRSPIVFTCSENLWNKTLFGTTHFDNIHFDCLKGVFFIKIPFSLNDLKKTIEEAQNFLSKKRLGSVEFNRAATCLSFPHHRHGEEEESPQNKEVEEFWKFQEEPIKVLVIEDKYEHIEKVLNAIGKKKCDMIKFIPYTKEKNDAEMRFEPKAILEQLKSSKDKYDLIFLDLVLQEVDREKEEIGLKRSEEILQKLNLGMPEIPVFVLTWESRLQKVREILLRFQADNFIHKSDMWSIPDQIARYFVDDIGRLVTLLPSDLKRNMVGNIRYWRFKKDLLWFGDKCYHMVEHSFKHISNDWELANDLLYPILKENIKLMGQENLYAFCMAIWLHDVGHKGNERYGEPHQIRDNHGLISAELVLKNPELFGIPKRFGINNNAGIDDYKDLAFPFGPGNKPLPQVMREKIKERKDSTRRKETSEKKEEKRKEETAETRRKGSNLTLIEKIALLSMYHKSNCPINKKDVELIIKRGKEIPLDFYEHCDKSKEVITLEDILNASTDEYDEVETFLSVAAIFRFVDGLDIRKNRVGDFTEEDLKKLVINNDKKYQIKRLKGEVESILRQGLGGERITNKTDRLSFTKIFYQEVKEKIERGMYVNYSDMLEVVKDLETDLKDYLLLLNYARFISVQDKHFNLHASIDEIKIIPDRENPMKIQIHYLSNQKGDGLFDQRRGVREYFQEEGKPVAHYLIGEKKDGTWEDGYFLRELGTMRTLMDKFFKIERLGLWGYADDESDRELKLIYGVKRRDLNGGFDIWYKIKDKKYPSEIKWKEFFLEQTTNPQHT